jgi:hypothetical protein
MTALFFATYLLSNGAGQPAVQTPVKNKASVSTSHKPQSSVRRNANRKGVTPQPALLQGAWSDCVDCNAIFWIEERRVNFFDEIGSDQKEGPTYWKMSGNKLSFCYSGGLVVTDTILKLTKDSLVLYRRDKQAGVVGYSRYVRLK